MFVVPTGATGMLTGVAAATGKEVGWRGFLVRELAKVLTSHSWQRRPASRTPGSG
jgi:hypothetical protein